MDNLTTRQRAPRGDFVQNGVYWNYVEEMTLLAADILQEVLYAYLKGLEKTVLFVEVKESGKKGQQSLANPAGNSKITSTPSASFQERSRFSKRSGHGSNPGKLSGSRHVQPGMPRVINVLRKAILKQPARARLSPQTRSLCWTRRRKER